MAIVLTDDKHYKDIANKIREIKQTNETMFPNEIAEKVQDVFEVGKKSQYDAFWDSYQSKGIAKKYHYAFCGICWSDNNFKPKYDIVFSEADGGMAFYNNQVTNIKGQLEECGVVLDTSRATGLYQAFMYAMTTELPQISVVNSTNLYSLFGGCSKLKRVDKLILKSDGTSPHLTSVFASCSALEHIEFEGLIGSSITMSSCSKLSVESAKSAINCLANYAGTDNEGVYSFKLHANTWTALEADSTAPNGSTWKEYVQSLGWLI